MSELLVQKTPVGWAPMDDDSKRIHSRHKLGAVIGAKFVQKRNGPFLRKYMSLLHLAFDYWDVADEEYKGQVVTKNFERFRKDIQILAGFGEPVWNIRGELRIESKSIAFDRMEQEEFDELYSCVVNVLLDRVLKAKGFTRESIDSLVDQLMSYA